MTRLTQPEINLAKIDLQARQMRAEMLANSFRRLGAWLRKPRAARPHKGSQTA